MTNQINQTRRPSTARTLWKALPVLLSLLALPSLPAAAQAPPSSMLQPFAPYWYPKTLLQWTPASDPDAAYNRSRIPLAERFHDPATRANPHARPGEARVVSLAAFGPTSKNPSQGSASFDTYAYNYWQYTDVLVYWGGSAGEGLILAPKPTVVDAAHRNGVPVLGTIFFPPSVYGGRIEWVRDLLQKNGDSFPVADKLIEVANYYGFDGWFFNQETEGGDAALAATMQEFLKYMRARTKQRIMWYDAMTQSGEIRWQGALNDVNSGFFSTSDTPRIADDLFIDFRWNPTRLESSRATAQRLGRDPYELYAGIDVEGSGYNRNARWEAIFPEGQPHTLSLGFYRPDWAFNSSKNVDEFYQKDSRFWVGANRDPRNTQADSSWKGIAHYIPERSPITRLPFVTHFNTGQGHLYAIDGAVRSRGDWNNLSLQEVLPTWRWVLESAGDAKLAPTLDWSDAFNGGTSLKVAGNLNAPNHLKLFSARLPVSRDTRLRLTYKTGVRKAPTHLQVGLAFTDAPTHFEYLNVGSTDSADWNTKTFDLGRYSGKTLSVISLRFAADTPMPNYEARIGQIAVFNGSVRAPAAPTQFRAEKQSEVSPGKISLRLQWNPSPDPVSAYHVYRQKRGGERVFLGGTPNSAYYVANLERDGSESETTLQVEAVGPDSGRSRSVTTRIVWAKP